MEKLKIGFVGLGQRGASFGMTDGSIGLLGNVLNNCEAKVTAICDGYKERIDFASQIIVAHGQAEPFKTTDYNQLIDSGVDAVIVCTKWAVHVEVALACMKKGVPVAIEVGGSHNLTDLWTLVDEYEKTKTPFMFLENCCYNKDELLATSLYRNGLLGEVSYCQGGYCHDLREEIVGQGLRQNHYRLEEYKNHNCENYPTHELGPIVKLLGITRGNKFNKLVSMASKAQGLNRYIEDHSEYSSLLGSKFKQGDIVNTLIECENGETIMLKLDTTLPRLYDRNFTVCGTKGTYCQTTKSVVLDGRFDHEVTEYKDVFFNQDEFNEYLPDDWKNITEVQLKTGHGGMDYIMLKHFFKAVANKEEMPVDVYEACAMMCVTALSEESIKRGSSPVEVPDFTRGKYRNRNIRDVVDLPIVR